MYELKLALQTNWGFTMRKMAVTLGCLMILAGSAQASDWPRWRGPERNSISRETGLLKKWPAGGPRVIWEAPIGGGTSTVAVVKGVVYTMCQDTSHEFAIALNDRDGKEIWRYKMGARYMNGAVGPRATPTLDGDRVYVVDCFGTLACLKAANGKEIWKVNFIKDAGAVQGKIHDKDNIVWGVSCSPFVSGGLVVVSPGTDQANRKTSAIMAYDKMTGAIVWRAANDLAGYGTPMEMKVGGVEMFVCHEAEKVYGIAPKDGKILWTYDWPKPTDGRKLSTTKVHCQSPLVQGDKVFISAGYGTGCVMLQIVPKGDGTFECKEFWPRNRAMSSRFCDPVWVGDWIYGNDMDVLTCVNAVTGAKGWMHGNELGYSHFSWADGLFFIQEEHGKLVLARMTPQKYEEISKFQMFTVGQQRYTTPTVVNKRLYVRDDKKIVCLDIAEK